MTSVPTLPFSQYVELFDRHERLALDAYGRLQADAQVGPQQHDALRHALEHLATLQVWAWLLDHPEADWRAFEEAALPHHYADVLSATDQERERLTRLFIDVGPDLALDYFGRPGTAHDVARLLAGEAIDTALATREAVGNPLEPLHPDVASDAVDRVLAHWDEPDADTQWHPAPAHLVATDTRRSWWVRFSEDQDGWGEITLVAESSPSLVVQGGSDALLRWLLGYPETSLEVQGDGATLRPLRTALGHRVEPAPRRRWWRRG